MANSISAHRLVDSTRRTLIKYVIMFDGTAESNTTLLDVSTLAYSLNANGKIMTGGVDPKPLYRTEIKRIMGQGSFKNKGHCMLLWGGRPGKANTDIVSFGDNSFDFNFDKEGLSAHIPVYDSANSSGDILLTTMSAAAGDMVTIFVDLKKDGRDFDQGQTADPAAFNAGPF